MKTRVSSPAGAPGEVQLGLRGGRGRGARRRARSRRRSRPRRRGTRPGSRRSARSSARGASASRPLVWLAAIVLSTASPSAPLICWERLVIPEPSPASAAGTSAIAIVSSGMNAVPMPRPIAKQARKIVGKKRGVRADGGEQEQAADGARHAGGEHAEAARSAPTSRAVMPCESDRDGERPGQERRAGLQRAVVADVLEVERAEEEGRVHPRDEEAPDEARVDQPAHAQDAQRHDRVLDPGLEREERRHQHRGERADAEHLSGDVQPWLVASTIA